MSVFFSDISPNNPVKQGDVEDLLSPLGVSVEPSDSPDFTHLLAALHDCAEHISSLPDYQPEPELKRYPRENVHLPSPDEQELGHAWATRFLIKGAPDAGGPLKGRRVVFKDCFAIAEVPQFFGSDAFPAWTPTTDATVVTRLLDAGADVVGTATCENFCNSTSSFTSAQGVVHNPHREGYSAGGSTSGGGALVGAGLVDIAIGSDQGGSIRVPAALCGCVGLKPTHGLVPCTGMTSGDAIDDHAGPLAPTVLAAAECLDAIAGYDKIDDRSLGAPPPNTFTFASSLTSSDLSGFKIGVLKEGFGLPVFQDQVKAQVVAAAHKFKALGATVEEVSVPLHLEGPAAWTIQQRISGALGVLGHASGHRGLGLPDLEAARLPWTDANFRKLFPSTQNTVINGLYLLRTFPGLYAKTVNLARRISDAYEEVFATYDVILMPTTPYVAPRNGTRGTPKTCFGPSIGLTSNTAVFNITGHPAMTIPVGWAPAREDESVELPVGMQIVGGLWQEKKILQAGHAWERSFDWKKERMASHGEVKGMRSAACGTQGAEEEMMDKKKKGGFVDVHTLPIEA